MNLSGNNPFLAEFAPLLDELALGPVLDHYIRSRILGQIWWHSKKADQHQALYERISNTITIIAVCSPLLVSFVPWLGDSLVMILTSIGSAVIGVLTNLDKRKKPGLYWLNFRNTEETLKRELHIFLTHAGKYSAGDHKRMTGLFVESCESMIAEEVRRFTRSEERGLSLEKVQQVEKVATSAAQGLAKKNA